MTKQMSSTFVTQKLIVVKKVWEMVSYTILGKKRWDPFIAGKGRQFKKGSSHVEWMKLPFSWENIFLVWEPNEQEPD